MTRTEILLFATGTLGTKGSVAGRAGDILLNVSGQTVRQRAQRPDRLGLTDLYDGPMGGIIQNGCNCRLENIPS